MNKYSTLGFSGLSYIVMAIMTTFVVENIYDHEWDTPTLYDVVHESVPVYPPKWITDHFVFFFMIYTMFRWGFINIDYLSIYFLSLTVLLLLRVITFTVTQTPPPTKIGSEYREKHCKAKILPQMGFTLNKYVYSCVDNMFSAHTAHIMVAFALIFLFSDNFAEKLALGLVAGVCAFSIASSRLHYTSDVVVSAMLSPLVVFAIYKNLFYTLP
jgi:hypothetical protein